MSIENLPFFTRVFHRVRRALNALLGYEEPTRFVMQRAEPCPISDMSYMLLEYIKPELGEMLSQTWETQRDDPALRTNFYRSLSHIMLSLAKIPLPTIGSFVIDDAGFLRLTNRPLTQEMHQLENENVPLEVPRDMTYTDAGSYANALLSYHNSRLRYQPNAIVDFGDGINQSASLAVMRSIWPGFFQTQYRRQFRFAFRDLHQSNIFVDSKWNITCLIDLEWACSIPLEMVTAPRWLSGEPIDGMSTERYDTCMKEFGEILAEDQEEACQSSQPSLSSTLLETWERGTFWYTLRSTVRQGLMLSSTTRSRIHSMRKILTRLKSHHFDTGDLRHMSLLRNELKTRSATTPTCEMHSLHKISPNRPPLQL